MDEPLHPVDFTADELATWSSFATMLEWLPVALDVQLQRDSNMSHFEYGLLYALSRAEGRTVRMSTLAGFANSTLSRLSRAVARLERRGWVQRSPDPIDGRVTTATLTPRGLDVTRAATPAHVALVRTLVFGSLTGGQAEELRRISSQIASSISADGRWVSGG